MLGFIPTFFIQQFIKDYKPSIGRTTTTETIMKSITSRSRPMTMSSNKNINDVNASPEIISLQTRVLSISDNDSNIDSLQSAPISPRNINEVVAIQKMNVKQLLQVCSDNSMTMIEKLTAMEQLRLMVFNRRYHYPHYCRYVSLCCTIILSLICGAITIIWCLWFEGSLKVENGYNNQVKLYDSCEIEVTPLETTLNYNASEAALEERVEVFELNDGSVYNSPSGDSFGFIFENLTITTRFLLCVSLSYILTIFLWQPLFIAVDHEPKQINNVLNQLKPQTNAEITMNVKTKTKAKQETAPSTIMTK